MSFKDCPSCGAHMQAEFNYAVQCHQCGCLVRAIDQTPKPNGGQFGPRRAIALYPTNPPQPVFAIPEDSGS